MPSSEVREVATPGGPARLHVTAPDGAPSGTLALGHGAGGGIEAVDMQAVAAAAVAIGWRVVLVEQPWRVAGRRVAAPPPRLDDAWLAALDDDRRATGAGPGGHPPLVVGGRSAGARVACRTATRLGAGGCLALAFPLHPPGRPARSRAEELALPLAAGLPTLVVQGRRDAFGTPEEVRVAVGAGDGPAGSSAGLALVEVDGDHSLKADPGAVARAVAAWLQRIA